MIKLEKYRTKFYYTSNDHTEISYFEKNFRMEIPNAYFSPNHTSKGGKWDGYINFCDKRSSSFSVGLLKDAIELFENSEINYKIDNQIPEFIPEIPLTDWLYEHQKEAVLEYLKHFHGIIKIPTRGGKTIFVAELNRVIRSAFDDLNCLFIVDTQLLLNQAVKDFAEFFKVDKSEIGIIKDTTFTIKKLTVATIQTLQSRITGTGAKVERDKKKYTTDELKLKRKKARDEKTKFLKYVNSVNFLVVDECHEYTSDKRINIIKKFKNLYMDLFISATPFKSEDEVGNKNLKIIAGDIIYEIKGKILKERGILATDKVFLFNIDHNKNRNITGDTYLELHKNIITHNPLRNQILLNTIEILRKLNLKTLVLLSEVKHGRYIQTITDDQFIDGSMKMDNREKQIVDFLKVKGSVILASNVFKKGITLPEVEVTFNAAGGLEQSNIVQKRGRGLGVTNIKKKALTLDFIDDYTEHFYKHSLSRIEAYEKEVGIENIEVFNADDNDMYRDLRDMLIGWFNL